MKRLIKALVERAGYAVLNARGRYLQNGLFTVHDDRFRRDPSFRAAYRRGMKASNGMVRHFEWRVHVALWAASTSLRLPGDFVECGVNAGFISSAMMHYLQWHSIDKHFYLIATFSGPILTQYSREEVEQGRRRLADDACCRCVCDGP